MALAVVRGAAARGRLAPGGTVVEYTGGSTGTSLAFVCAALGYPITLVTSDAFSREKRDHMRALGATVVELPSEGGRTTRELIQRMIAKAAELSAASDAFYADQFNNPDAAAGYAPLADELWEQSRGRLDAFVQSVGTAQCITGVAAVLRSHNPRIRVAAVEPAESRRAERGRARTAQDRRGRPRLRAADVAARSRRRDRPGLHRRGQRHGAAARAGGGHVRRNLDRRERGGGIAGSPGASGRGGPSPRSSATRASSTCSTDLYSSG